MIFIRKQNNDYDISLYDYGVGWTTNTNEEFYFDLEDYDLIKNYAWREICDHNGYRYVCTTTHNNGEANVLKLCKLITGYTYCEHADKNPFNNRKNNLRQSSHEENMQNKKLYKNNKSGFPGIVWQERYGKWAASIRYKGKDYHLGYFNKFEDAVIARLRGEAKYFNPDFAPHRDLFEKYGIVVEDVKQEEDKKLSSNNTSGITGVSYNTKKNKWAAQMRYNNKNCLSKFFDNKDDAIKARLETEAKYYGNLAPQQHLFEQYGITYNNKESE